MNYLEKLTIGDQVEKDFNRVISNAGFIIASAECGPFGCLFGRDAAISAIFFLYGRKLELKLGQNAGEASLSLNGRLFGAVRKSLEVLAGFQGKKIDEIREEQPGKIGHEFRFGKANLCHLRKLERNGWPVEKEFLKYYGSLDATPLWLVASLMYVEESGDFGFFEKYKENIYAAFKWMKDYGDMDGDGFLEFSAKNRRALLNHFWKDSNDSILVGEGKGERPKEPIASVETQGYAYWAYKKGQEFFKKTGETKFAEQLGESAGKLKEKFNKAFWMADEGFFAYALDGDKKQVREITSNPGHLLITGIVDDDKIEPLVKRLMKKDMLTKYGIRTLSQKSKFFTMRWPRAYHRGTIWPHDNAWLVLGLRKHGFIKEAEIVERGILEATCPSKLGSEELFHVKRDGKSLVRYKNAGNPQAWTVATKYLFIQKPSFN